MRQTTYTTRVLIPSEGHVLTQAADVADNDRVFSTKVFLAANDDPASWREIAAAEADTIKARVAGAAGKEAANG